MKAAFHPRRPTALLALGLALSLAATAASAPARAQQQIPPALGEWMHNEQQLLSREVDERRLMRLDNAQDRRFAPEEGRTFAIRSYWLDVDRTHFLTSAQLDPETRRLFVRDVGGRTQVRLLVHPESERFYRDVTAHAERGDDFQATATASSRTLLVWQPGRERDAFFAKVSLDVEIGGVTRTIPQSEVARSIGTANVLATEHDLPQGFDILPEVIGMIPRGMPRGGMIIRQIPRDIRAGERRFVPLFSLYARPRDGSAPMLAQMIRRSGQTPTDFVRGRIVEPFARMWTELAVRRGITSEPHAQNVLLEVGADGLPNGNFLMRDFGGFDVDFEYRDALGIERPTELPHIGTFEHDYHLDENVDRFTKLETFFVGGFLHNLDQNVPQWQRQGLVQGPRLGAQPFSRMLAGSVESHLTRLAGRPVTVGGSVANMARAMGVARVAVRNQALVTMRAAGGRVGPQPGAGTAGTGQDESTGSGDHGGAGGAGLDPAAHEQGGRGGGLLGWIRSGGRSAGRPNASATPSSGRRPPAGQRPARPTPPTTRPGGPTPLPPGPGAPRR